MPDDNAKVLVIEPNHDSQSEFQLILENEFFVPVVADTSREASVNAAFKDIQRLLLRFDAPKLVSTTAWRTLRATGTEAQLIVLSARCRKQLSAAARRWGRQLGNKPVRTRELLGAYRAVLWHHGVARR